MGNPFTIPSDFDFRTGNHCRLSKPETALGKFHIPPPIQVASDLILNRRRMGVDDPDEIDPLPVRGLLKDIVKGELTGARNFNRQTAFGSPDMDMEIGEHLL